MNIMINDWWEMVIVGIVLLLSLYIIYLIVRLFLTKGGKLKLKGAEIMGNNLDCSDYVKEHTQLLTDMYISLIDM